MPQPHKGPRDTATVRMSTPLGSAVRREAKARCVSVSDYVAAVLAHALDMPDEAPQTRSKADKELPLDT